jgi:hypothetical protein
LTFVKFFFTLVLSSVPGTDRLAHKALGCQSPGALCFGSMYLTQHCIGVAHRSAFQDLKTTPVPSLSGSKADLENHQTLTGPAVLRLLLLKRLLH